MNKPSKTAIEAAKRFRATHTHLTSDWAEDYLAQAFQSAIDKATEREKWGVRRHPDGYMIFAASGCDVVDFVWPDRKYPDQLVAAHNKTL